MLSPIQRRLRITGAVFCGIVLIGLSLFAWAWSKFRASLPELDGTRVVAGLSASVTVERDALGVPTLRGASRYDLSRALGYLHGQDRFFQMDLSRRRAAGELAELFGPAALPLDRGARVHELRPLSSQILARLSPVERQLIESYTAGVNAALQSFADRPWEYLALRSDPRPWLPEDTLLCVYAMAFDLQDETGTYERTLMVLRNQLGSAGLAFFAPAIGPADAALDGSTAPLPTPPGPRILDLRRLRTAPDKATVSLPLDFPAERLTSGYEHDPEARPGSNSFGIAGPTTGGPATLENDMHLSLGVPGVWYRARLQWTDPGPAAKPHDVTGVTLPGVPAIVVGSNGSIAWGFTNSYTDCGDLVQVQTDEVTPDMLYVYDGKVLDFENRTQKIRVKGEPDHEMTTRWTIWGPIVGETEGKRPLAFKWLLREPGTINLQLMGLETAQTVDEALAIAHVAGMPALNLLVADRSGALAWTIAGRLPRRVGHDGRLPISWAYGDRGWNGLLPPEEVPVYRAPPGGALWSANQRQLGGDALQLLGDSGYNADARAARLRDRAQAIAKEAARQPVAATDYLAVALDDRADFLDRWQRKLLDVLTPAAVARHPDRAKVRKLAENWQGRATVDSVSYRLVRTWRQRVASRVMDPIFATCREHWDGFNFRALPYEHPLWALLEQKPMHLLMGDYSSWDDLLLAAVDDVVAAVKKSGASLEQATWGNYNTITLRHPFSRNLPGFLAKYLDMPTQELPGDLGMPRVQTRIDGASQRMVVAPGREKDAIFHMPAGQSGHPLSPYYRAGHQAWVRGESTPFLPGPARHTLTLTP